MYPRRLLLMFLPALLCACSAEYHANRGREALDAHDLAEAETRFRAALERDGDYVPALTGLGWTYQVAGQHDAARSAFQRCATLSPELAECKRGLASVALSEGNLAGAHQLLLDAEKLAPDDPGVASSLALQEMSSGELESARKRYEALVSRFPDLAEYRAGLAEVLLRQDQPDQCLEAVEAALKDEGAPARYRALLFALKARALVASTSGRLNPQDCAATAPPVLAWLDAADRATASAEATGVELPDLPAVKRLVAKRRGAVEDRCPGLRATP